jgi:hypothetical protein
MQPLAVAVLVALVVGDSFADPVIISPTDGTNPPPWTDMDLGLKRSDVAVSSRS